MQILNEIENEDEISKFTDFFIFKKILGSGSFGNVVAAICKQDGSECAVKIIPKNNVNQKEMTRLRDEAGILSSLLSPNIVKFKEVYFHYHKLLLNFYLRILIIYRNKKMIFFIF